MFVILSKVRLVLVCGSPIKDPGPVANVQQPSLLPVPCNLLDQFKSLNVDVSLPCIDEVTSTVKPCILESSAANSTSDKDCADSEQRQRSFPPFCDQLSGYNLSLPCQKVSERRAEPIPRNVFDLEEGGVKPSGMATPDCVRLMDDLSGQVTACETVRNYPE